MWTATYARVRATRTKKTTMQNILDKLPRIGKAMLASVAATALGSCMVGPDFHRPESPSTTQYTEHSLPQETVSSPGTAGAAQRFASGADISAQWWALYRSEPLDRLIREAIADSPNLA